MKTSKPLLLLILVLLGVIVYLRTCSRPAEVKPPVVDIIRETTYQVIHDTVRLAPVIEKQFVAGNQVKIIDTEWIDNTREVDTARILRNFFATNYYPYRYVTKYGEIIIQDSISQNKIRSRRVINNQRIPTVTTTKTITLQPKPSWQIYIGGSLLGGKENVLSGFGPDILLKTKRDQIYQVGAYYTTQGTIAYRAGMLFKLHF